MIARGLLFIILFLLFATKLLASPMPPSTTCFIDATVVTKQAFSNQLRLEVNSIKLLNKEKWDSITCDENFKKKIEDQEVLFSSENGVDFESIQPGMNLTGTVEFRGDEFSGPYLLFTQEEMTVDSQITPTAFLPTATSAPITSLTQFAQVTPEILHEQEKTNNSGNIPIWLSLTAMMVIIIGAITAIAFITRKKVINDSDPNFPDDSLHENISNDIQPPQTDI